MSEAEDTVASARELYDREPTFRAGIAAWIADRRCDLRLVDLLLEYGLASQADCARWAAAEPDRLFAVGRSEGKATGEKCGPFPCVYDGNFYWYDCENGGMPQDAHDIPRKYFGREVNYRTDKFESATDAILFLLDIWKPEKPTRKRRKKE